MNLLFKNWKDKPWLDYVILFGMTYPFFKVLGWFRNAFLLSNGDSLQVINSFYATLVDSLEKTGSLDPWNPFIWGGMQAIGNPNMAMNPLIYLALLTGKPGFFVALDIFLYLEILLGGIGVYLVTRVLVKNRPLAILAALLYTYSTPPAVYIAYYNLHVQFGVVPWIIYLLLTFRDRNKYTHVLLLSLTLYLQLTFGQLQFTIYSFYFYVLFPWVASKDWRHYYATMKPLFVSFVVTFFLGLHFELPILEFLATYKDRQNFDWWHYSGETKVAYPYIFNIVRPHFFHKNVQFWPKWQDGWSLLESSFVWIGTLPGLFFLSSLFGFKKFKLALGNDYRLFRNLCIFSIILIVLNFTRLGGTILLAMGGGTSVPFSRSTIYLLYPLLLVFVLILKHFDNKKLPLKPFYIFTGVGILSLALLQLKAIRYGTSFLFFSYAKVSSKFPEWIRKKDGFFEEYVIEAFWVFIIFLVGVVLVRWVKVQKLRRTLLVGLVAFSFYENYDFLFRWFLPIHGPPYPFREYFIPKNPVLDFLKSRPDLGTYLAFNGTKKREYFMGITPNQNSIHSVPMMNGYTSVVPRLSAIEPYIFRANYGGTPLPENLVKLHSVKYLVFSDKKNPMKEALWPHLTKRLEHKDVEIYEYGEAVPRFYFPREIVPIKDREIYLKNLREVSFDPQKKSFIEGGTAYKFPGNCEPSVKPVRSLLNSEVDLEVHNSCNEAVWLSTGIPRHGWWRYLINGQEVDALVVNEIQTTVRVPPGRHKFSMRLDPQLWRIGLYFSWATLVGLLIWWVRGRFRWF